MFFFLCNENKFYTMNFTARPSATVSETTYDRFRPYEN